MKRNHLRPIDRMLRLLPVFLAVAALCGLLTVAFAEETPEIAIKGIALSMEDAVYLEYGVECAGFTPTKTNIGMLFWTAEPENPVKGTEEACGAVLGVDNSNNENKNYYIFQYRELTACRMCDEIWARAYAVVDGVYHYSELEQYSVVTYAARKLGLVPGVEGTEDETLRVLLREMLEYGEAAQKHFGYRTDVLPTDILPENRFTVTFDTAGGNEIPAQTVCRGRYAACPEAPEKDGYTFVGWFNGEDAWNFASDAVTENLTLTAHWKQRFAEGLIYAENEDGTCTVAGLGECTDRVLNIPAQSPDGKKVTAIGAGAFRNASELTRVMIPDGVTRIGDNAFAGCSGLVELVFHGTSEQWNALDFGTDWRLGAGDFTLTCTGDDLLFTRLADGTYSVSAKEGFSRAELVIPAMYNGQPVTEIGFRAFYYNYSIESVVMPDSVKVIREEAFYSCGYLKSVSFSKQLEQIRQSAFLDCYNLTSIVLPEGLLLIEHCAFKYCPWENIILPDSVTTIAPDSFSFSAAKTFHIGAGLKNFVSGGYSLDVNRLETITVDERNTVFHATNNCLIETATKTLLLGCKNSIIPNDGSVTRIDLLGFCHCTDLETIEIPDCIEEINNPFGFWDCDRLSEIVIPDSVKGRVYFGRCAALKTVTLGKQISEIDGFYDCTSLTTVNLTNSVTRIGRQAFYACESLTDLNFAGTMEEWNRIEKEDGWDVGTGNYTVHCTDGDIMKA